MSFILHRQLLLDMVDTNVEFSFAPGVHRKYQRIGRIESLRVGREEHVPESSDHARYWLKLCSSSYPSEKLWREPDIKWFDLTVAPVSKNMQRFALQYRKEPSRLKKCGKQLRAAENFENTVEGERLLLANIMEDTWLKISPFTRNLETE